MTEMDGKSEDLVKDNIQALGKLFPEVLCDGKIDFHKLQNLLGDAIDNAGDRYNFTWHGKDAALRLSQTPSLGTLRPCKEESKDWDTTQNLYIEGDNLEVLKLLQKSYHGKVKMIYIDPPYNTGSDFVYHDDFRDSLENYKRLTGQADDDGKTYTTNSETSGRYHTDWLNMIYPRLRLARNLLREDGVIFISIDDNEGDNLKKVCDEVFGEECFVANIAWQRTYSTRNDSKGIVNEVEHILTYSKRPNWSPKKLPRTEEMDAKYKNPDDDVSSWTSDNPFAPGAATHQGMVYAIQHPFTGEMIYPSDRACWRYQQDEMLNIMNGWCPYVLKDLHDAERRAEVCGIDSADIKQDVKGIVLADDPEVAKAKARAVYERGQWPKFYFTKGGTGGIRRKTYLNSLEGKLPTNLWLYSDVGHTDEAKKEVKTIFGGAAPFDTPKPTRLVDRMMEIATDEDSLILDFFSGSATTGQAVMKRNAEDKGTRRFILVQLPEPSPSPQYETICKIGEERIRRAGEQYKDKGVDVGFRVFKLDTSNLKKWQPPKDDATLEQTLQESVNNIASDRTEEDLLYEIILKMGFDLSWPIEAHDVGGVQVFVVAAGALFICLADNITPTVAEGMAKLHHELAPEVWKVVCRDTGFRDDAAKVNVREILKAEGLDDAAFVTV